MIQCVEVLFVWCIWLYVLIMSRTRFRLNPHSVWMSKLPECQRSVYRVWIDSETCTWHVRTYSQMHRTYKYSQHSSIIWPVWLNDWVSVRLRTKWLWVRVQLQSLKLHISRLLRARSSLTFRQLQSVDSLWNAYVTWQEHTVKCTVQISTHNTA